MEYLNNWTAWLIFGFILLILELAIPGVFLMWWGFAAIITATVASFLSLTWQISFFAVLATFFSLAWWKYQRKKDQIDDRQTELNARNHHLIGSIGVVEEITPTNIIRAKFGDTTWKVQGENLNVGDKVQVLKTEGIVLLVRKVNEP